jgi:uncharacterized membrane protein YfcA
MDQDSIGWRSLLPIAVLLAVIVLAAAFVTCCAETGDVPPLTASGVLLLLSIGLIAGIFGGLVGVGGSTFLLPIMYFYLGFPEPIAVGTALFVVIFTSISGASGHLVRKNLDCRVAAWIAIGGLAGVLLGSWLFTLLVGSTLALDLILGIVFLVPALNMIRGGIRPDRVPEPLGSRIGGSPPILIAFGAAVGVLTGVTGLGGGYALVPGLIFFFGAPVYVTMGTSLAAMVPMAIVGGGIKVAGGFVALGAGLILAAGSVLGAQVGAASIKRFSPPTLKLIFGIYFLYVAIRFIADFFGISLL